MVDLNTRLNNAVTKLETDSGIMHSIVHGANNATVTTEGGPVNTISKTIFDAAATFASAYSAIATVANNFVYDSATTMTSPGTGKLKFNNASLASATQLAIMNTTNEFGNPNIGPYINTWDDSTNLAAKGYLTVRKKTDASVYATFILTGSVTDNTTWKQMAVSYVGGNGTLTTLDEVYVGFTRVGDKLNYSNTIWGGTGGGTANAQTMTPSPAYTSYVTGDTGFYVPNVTNTGSATGAIGTAGTRTWKKLYGQAKVNIAANDLVSGVAAEFLIDGVDLILLNPQTQGSAIGASIASASPLVLSSTTGDVITVTGNTSFSAITLPEGQQRLVKFTGTPTITESATLILSDGQGSWVIAGSENWAIVQGLSGGVVSVNPLTRPSMTTTGAYRNLKVDVTSATGITVSYDDLILKDINGRTMNVYGNSHNIVISTAGAGGLDTGTNALGWYYVWVISKPDRTTAAMISLSATAPTMPAGYTYKAYVGAVYNGALNTLWKTIQYGNRASWVKTGSQNPNGGLQILAQNSNGGAWGAIAAQGANAVSPPTAKSIMVIVLQEAGGTSVGVSPNNIGSVTQDYVGVGGFAGLSVSQEIVFETTNIYYWSNSGTCKLKVQGWTDRILA